MLRLGTEIEIFKRDNDEVQAIDKPPHVCIDVDGGSDSVA